MSDNTSDIKKLALPLEFHWPDGVVTRFADQFMIQVSDTTCSLGFFESLPPWFVGATAEEIEKIKSVRAEGVAKIVVTLPKMVEIFNAIQTALTQVGAVKPSETGTGADIE